MRNKNQSKAWTKACQVLARQFFRDPVKAPKKLILVKAIRRSRSWSSEKEMEKYKRNLLSKLKEM